MLVFEGFRDCGLSSEPVASSHQLRYERLPGPSEARLAACTGPPAAPPATARLGRDRRPIHRELVTAFWLYSWLIAVDGASLNRYDALTGESE